MTPEILVTSLMIVAARIIDVSMGTVRTLCVIRGRAVNAWFLGFFELLIWVFVVSKVIQNLDVPYYAVAYALGFATGNVVGLWVEKQLAFGEQVVRIFTRKSDEVARSLRQRGFAITVFEGQGREGPVGMLFIQTMRKKVGSLLDLAGRLDPQSFYIVDDIRMAAHTAPMGFNPTGWRAVKKKK